MRRAERSGETRGREAIGTAGVVWLGLAAAVGAATQEGPPLVPSGVPVALLPVQSVAPAPSGIWPGGASSSSEARRRMNAELDFALGSSEATRGWTGPRELARLVDRNPMIDVDPHRLAVDRLAAGDSPDEGLREPLHRQLRRLTALADVRLAAIPLRLAWRSPDAEAEGSGKSDVAAPGERGDSGRAVLELALVDTRAARVLWLGEIRADRAPPDAPGTMAALAEDLVRLLSP